MAIKLYDPSPAWSDFQRDISRFFERAAGPVERRDARRWTPAVDVIERADDFLLEAELPGVTPDAISVTVDQNILTLSAERVAAEMAEGDAPRLRERRAGRFERRFELPETADGERVEAKSEHGVLRVTIAKKARAEARRITVDA